MRDYVLRLIERDLSKPTMAEWLDEISRRKPLGPGASGAELVAEARAEREAEIDAWLEELAKRRRTRSARD